MKPVPRPTSVRSTKEYDALLKALYLGAKPRVEEIEIPPVPVVSVTGNEPPGSGQYQDAIAALYGLGYGLKMGLKYGKLPRPASYFDYKVGALETLWWSVTGEIDIANPTTLRWQAYLMVPAFVTAELLEAACRQAEEKHPETPYERARLASVDEGHAVQALHVGPYDQEGPTLERLERYVADHGLAQVGKHHEVYLSDPRRTPPEKLKTVLRYAVAPALR